MKQKVEFEIDVPDGKKAVWKDGKVVFEDIKPPLPKTWEEFCEQNKVKNGEYFINGDSGILAAGKGERYQNADRNILPSKQEAERHLALMQLHQLRDCYRQGWIPDCMDNSKKWYIINFKNKFYINSTQSYKIFLSFQTRETAELFLKNFKVLIEQAGDLI